MLILRHRLFKNMHISQRYCQLVLQVILQAAENQFTDNPWNTEFYHYILLYITDLNFKKIYIKKSV